MPRTQNHKHTCPKVGDAVEVTLRHTLLGGLSGKVVWSGSAAAVVQIGELKRFLPFSYLRKTANSL